MRRMGYARILLLLCFLLCIHSVLSVSIRIGVPLPFSNPLENLQSLRIQSVADLATKDLNSGRMQPPGLAQPYQVPTRPLELVYDDLGVTPESNAMASILRLTSASNPSPIVGVMGGLESDSTESLSIAAGVQGIPIISPWVSTSLLGESSSHPSLFRLLPDEGSIAWGLYRILVKSRWWRVSVWSLDDGPSKGIADLLINLIAADGLELIEDPISGSWNKTERTLANRFQFATHYVIPSSVQDLDIYNRTQVAVDQALLDAIASDVRIHILIGGTGNAGPSSSAARTIKLILRRAYESGFMGTLSTHAVLGTTDIQWIGAGFCDRSGVIDMLKIQEPNINSAQYQGLICLGPAYPRTFDSPAGLTNPHAVAFQTRLQQYNSTLFPSTYELQNTEVQAYNSIIVLGAGLQVLSNDPILGQVVPTAPIVQKALYFVTSTLQNQVYGIDGILLKFNQPTFNGATTILSNSAGLNPIEIFNFNPLIGNFWSIGLIDVEHLSANFSRTNIIYPDGSHVYTKDRSSVYVDGDIMPPQKYDAKIIVLSYCLGVLGIWTCFILIEQGISSLSMNNIPRMIQWNILASICFCGCAVWPIFVLNYCAMQLDTIIIRFTGTSILVALFFPMPVMTGIFCLGARANVNARLVANKYNAKNDGGGIGRSQNSQGGGSKNSKSPGISGQGRGGKISASGNSRTAVSLNIVQEMRKGIEALKGDWSVIGTKFTWRSTSLTLVTGIMMVLDLFIIQNGIVTDATLSVPLGNYFGAAILCVVLFWPCMIICIHLLKSSMRYVAPFVMSIVLLAIFHIILSTTGVRWTFSEQYIYTDPDTAIRTMTYPTQSFPADSSIEIGVALSAFIFVTGCMILNINSLRISKNVLDKLLMKVQEQVSSLETELQIDQTARERHIESGRFYRRNIELINLCRPVFRSYALAIALAEPNIAPDSLEQALGLMKEDIVPVSTAVGRPATLGIPTKRASKVTSAHDKEKSKSSQQHHGLAERKEEEKSRGSIAAGVGATADPASQIGGLEAVDEEKKDAIESKQGIVGSAVADKEVSMTGDAAVREKSATANSKGAASTGGSHPTGPTKIHIAPRPRGAAARTGGAAASNNASNSSKSVALSLVSGSDFQLIHTPKNEKQLLQILNELKEFNFIDAVPSLSTSSSSAAAAAASFSPFSPQSIHQRMLSEIKLPQLLSNPLTLELIKDILTKQLSPENMALWIDIQRYRSLDSMLSRKIIAEELYQIFICSGAKYEVNLSSSMKDSIVSKINRNRFTLDLFDEVEKEIYRLIQLNNFSEIIITPHLFKMSAILLGQKDHTMRSVVPVGTGISSVHAAQIIGYTQANASSTAAPTVGRPPSISRPSASAIGALVAILPGISNKTASGGQPITPGANGNSIDRKPSIASPVAPKSPDDTKATSSTPVSRKPSNAGLAKSPTLSKEDLEEIESRRFMYPGTMHSNIAGGGGDAQVEEEIDRLVNPGREVSNLMNPGKGKGRASPVVRSNAVPSSSLPGADGTNIHALSDYTLTLSNSAVAITSPSATLPDSTLHTSPMSEEKSEAMGDLEKLNVDTGSSSPAPSP